MDPPNGNERKFLCLYLVAIGKEGGGPKTLVMEIFNRT